MTAESIIGILIPFLGTIAGAACVLFVKNNLPDFVQRMLTGFAAGVMVAASVWSLLIPAMQQSEALGRWAFAPAAIGFALGIGLMLLLDRLIPHLHLNSEQAEGPKSHLQRKLLMVLAVTLHNLPEGMAVGIVFAGFLSASHELTLAAATALSIGIAIQNFPEGAIISMPLVGAGLTRKRAFAYGFLSGVVEPVGALLTVLLTSLIQPALPFILAFAAGAMIYVVIEELIPESQAGDHSNIGTIGAALGFALMMVLDVALG